MAAALRATGPVRWAFRRRPCDDEGVRRVLFAFVPAVLGGLAGCRARAEDAPGWRAELEAPAPWRPGYQSPVPATSRREGPAPSGAASVRPQAPSASSHRRAPSSRAPRAAPSSPGDGSPWSTPEACRAGLTKRRVRAPGTARIGTWNVRWFPDGVPGKRPPPDAATDLEWLACAIALLDVDVLAVQEFKTHPAAVAATAQLTAALDRSAGGRWRAAFDDCENVAGQHVGLLYDAARVSARGFTTYGGLNPHGVACQDQLRPGFGAHFRFPGGLDLHVISVHLKSGGERRSLTLRQRSVTALPGAVSEARAVVADEDVVFAGDFNTMGCGSCSPPVSAGEELEDFRRRLVGPGLRAVAPTVGCTEYFRGHGALLDHFVVAGALAELPAGASAEVSGVCGAVACAPRRSRSLAEERLSDHCPLVLSLVDRDWD